MKLIDLLNKIANKEKVPQIITFKGERYEWTGFCYKNYYGTSLGQNWTIDELLKEEIEILNENKYIDYVGKEYDLTKFRLDYEEPAVMMKDMGDKIKEMIEHINMIEDNMQHIPKIY